MDKYTANRYIWLKQQIAAGGGSVPQDLIDEVNALDATVNGDDTQDPPIVGLVDIVGDLGDVVEDLDIDINGDDTTEPPTPGLKDRVTELETTINGDATTTPATPGLVDRVSDIESLLEKTDLSSSVDITSYTTDPYTTDVDGYARIIGSGYIRLDETAILSGAGAGVYISCYVKAGSKLTVSGNPTDAVFIPMTHST